MKSSISVALAVFLGLSTTGCVYVNGERISHEDWRDEQRENRQVISQLEMGMARGDVVGKLGTPSESEAFDRDGEEVRVLFYRTQRKHSDGNTSRDETTPLVFVDDVLVGWGDSVYEQLR